MEALNKLQFSTAGKFGDKLTRDAHCDAHGHYLESGHRFFGDKIIWSGCRACLPASSEAEQKKQRQQTENRLNQAAIPLRFRSRNFQNFIATTPDQQNAWQVANNYALNFSLHKRTGGSLIFSGRAGTGKSHLALAIAQAIIDQHSVLYLNAMDAVRMIRDTWRKTSLQSETGILNWLGGIDLLIIDEIGVQHGTDSEQVLMFDIINRRYRDMKPTLFLTNLNTKGFSEFITERSYDRLKECSTWVTFNWESHRQAKAAH